MTSKKSITALTLDAQAAESLDDLLARLFGAWRLDFDHDAARSYAELTRRPPVRRCRWRMD